VAEERMFERAALALVEGILLALLLSALWAWIARILPFDLFVELPGEILARTHPTPFDLGIALAGGAAASYALAQPRLSAALPGVAIATALMPPLCTAGIGMAIGQWTVAIGALLLFVTNLAAISFAGILVFVALGFRPLRREQHWHRIPRSLSISAILVLVVTVPLFLLTMRLVDQARFNKQVQDVVADEVASLPDAQIMSVASNRIGSDLHLQVNILTSRPPSHEEVVRLQEQIAVQLEQPVALQLVVVPGTRLDPLIPPTRTPTNMPTQTRTRTPSPSPSLTATPTLTASPTYTPTAVLAYVANTGGQGVYVYDAPSGRIVGALAEGIAVHILYNRATLDGHAWLEIRLPDDSVAWLRTEYLVIRP
jgi:uncharacterized membrane protein